MDSRDWHLQDKPANHLQPSAGKWNDLDDLEKYVVDCTLCFPNLGQSGVRAYASKIVNLSWVKSPQTDPVHIDVMVIGEGPSLDPSLVQIRPTLQTSVSAQYFWDKIVPELGIQNMTIYLTNAFKCIDVSVRPPQMGNIDTCTKQWLQDEIKFCEEQGCKIIITLGSKARQAVRGLGLWHFYPLQHPSAILREQKREKDYLKRCRLLKAVIDEKVNGISPKPFDMEGLTFE